MTTKFRGRVSPQDRADYDYKIVTYRKWQIIVIVDLNQGRRSVTNDIENVLDRIQVAKGWTADELVEHLVVYKDSTDRWEGYSFETQWFISLNEITEQRAIEKIVAVHEGKPYKK